MDLAAGTRDFRVALERGSPWTLGAAESAEAPNIEVRERCVRPRGTTSLSLERRAGAAFVKTRRASAVGWEYDASGNEISSSVLEGRSVEVSKKEKVQNDFHVTDAHTKRDVEKVTNKQKRPVSFVGLRAARRFRLPPFFLFAFPKLAVKTTPNSDMMRKNGQTLDARR